MPTDEIQLLRDYAKTRSQTSFSTLVERYVDLVYSAARRQCRGDAHLAEDVTQAVFIILADKAATIPADRPLSAWLLRTCAYCAANARRSKTHREHYERRAAQMARMNETSQVGSANDDAPWDELSPLLDEGMNKLRPQDRDALLLKFFEKKSMRQIGDALGISEEAAGKRVARAVDRLRDFFRRRGVAVSAVALPALLMANAAHAAPAGMISTVVATSAGSAAAAAATATTAATTSSAAAVAKGALAVMAAEKVKAVALAAALIVAGVGAAAVVVTTVTSPIRNQNRQVSVANSVPATPAAITTANTPWIVHLPDGTRVDVLGLCEASVAINPSAAPTTWWTLDGSLTSAPAAYRQGLVSIPVQEGARRIQVVVRFNGVPANADRTVILRPNAGGGTTVTSDEANGGGGEVGRLTHHVTWVSSQQQTADLILALGTGPSSPCVELRNISLVPGKRTSVGLVKASNAQAAAKAR